MWYKIKAFFGWSSSDSFMSEDEGINLEGTFLDLDEGKENA